MAPVTRPEPRSAAERKADTLAKLTAPAADAWVASAGTGPHLVPLSLAWIDDRVVVAVETTSVTFRNIAGAGVARIGLGPTRDVVLIDAALEGAHPTADASGRLADAYAAQSDWDPRDAGEGYAYLVLRPDRVQAWTEVHELPGRTIMRSGAWLV
jgi:hypothetical protein